jgi:hypothetical protein
MNPLLRIGIGVLVILHGLVHPIMAIVPQRIENQSAENPPILGGFWTGSWLLGESATVKTLIYLFSALAALVLLVAGIGFINSLSWAKAMWIAGAILSLLVLIVFWDRYFIIGVAIDIVMLTIPFITTWLET